MLLGLKVPPLIPETSEASATISKRARANTIGDVVGATAAAGETTPTGKAAPSASAATPASSSADGKGKGKKKNNSNNKNNNKDAAQEAQMSALTKQSLMMAQQMREMRAVVVETIIVPQESDPVKEIKKATSNYALRHKDATTEERDIMGQPFLYAFQALFELCHAKAAETSADALVALENMVSDLNSVDEDERPALLARKVKMCKLSKMFKKPQEEEKMRLEVSICPHGDAYVCWTNMKEILKEHYECVEKTGPAPRGGLERILQGFLD